MEKWLEEAISRAKKLDSYYDKYLVNLLDARDMARVIKMKKGGDINDVAIIEGLIKAYLAMPKNHAGRIECEMCGKMTPDDHRDCVHCGGWA